MYYTIWQARNAQIQAVVWHSDCLMMPSVSKSRSEGSVAQASTQVHAHMYIHTVYLPFLPFLLNL